MLIYFSFINRVKVFAISSTIILLLKNTPFKKCINQALLVTLTKIIDML